MPTQKHCEILTAKLTIVLLPVSLNHGIDLAELNKRLNIVFSSLECLEFATGELLPL